MCWNGKDFYKCTDRNNIEIFIAEVFSTCSVFFQNFADNDVITNVTYYSLVYPSGSSKYGVIPNYFFPYR